MMSLPFLVTPKALDHGEALPDLLWHQITALLEAGTGWRDLPEDLRGAFCLLYYWQQILNGGPVQFIENALGFYGGSALNILAWAGDCATALDLPEIAGTIASARQRISACPGERAACADPDFDGNGGLSPFEERFYAVAKVGRDQDEVRTALAAHLRLRMPMRSVGQGDYDDALRLLAQDKAGAGGAAVKLARLRREITDLAFEPGTVLMMSLMEGSPWAGTAFGHVSSLADGTLTATSLDGLARFSCSFSGGQARLYQQPSELSLKMAEAIEDSRRPLPQHLLGLATDEGYRRMQQKGKRLQDQIRDAGRPIGLRPADSGDRIIQQIHDCCIAEALVQLCSEHNLSLRRGTRSVPEQAGSRIRCAVPTQSRQWLLVESDGTTVTASLDTSPVYSRDIAALLQLRKRLDEASARD